MQFYLFIFKFFILISLGSKTFAKCNFKSAEFEKELGNPKQIELIKVRFDNYQKWTINSILLYSKGPFFDQKLKTNFKGTIYIKYKFGSCKYKAQIRQKGDLVDHIQKTKINNNEHLISSIRVKLRKGNIQNATNFNLFLPVTRNKNSEVFTTIFIKNNNFISPNTFFVKVDFNGYVTNYLFQEEIRKELIENSGYIEGPLLKGDETLLYSKNNISDLNTLRFNLNNIMAIKFINKKYMLKEHIFEKSFNSYMSLQNSFLDFLNPNYNDELFFNPNFKNLHKNFYDKFNFLMIAIGGQHGLIKNNRRFYFNLIREYFHPIYYDGNPTFKLPEIIQITDSNILNKKKIVNHLLNFNKSIKPIKICNEFFKKTNLKKKEAFTFCREKIKITIKNLKDFLNRYDKIFDVKKYNYSNISKEMKLEKALNHYKLNGVMYKLIEKNDGSKYKFDCFPKKNCNTLVLDKKQIYKILVKEKNPENNIYIIESKIKPLSKRINSVTLPLGKLIIYGDGLIKVDKKKKVIILSQTKPHDKFLFLNSNIVDWKIKFNGIKSSSPPIKNINNSNSKFLTGCLTFYNSKFKNVKIEGNNGLCEDVINILKSNGEIDYIFIKEAFSDGLDIDFSKLSIKNLIIQNALNDCSDFSFGNYLISNIKVKKCGDKGVSVGERSHVDIGEMNSDETKTSIASKDSSFTIVRDFKAKMTELCSGVYNKKSEFGGATLKFFNYSCKGKNFVDKHSVLKIKNDI